MRLVNSLILGFKAPGVAACLGGLGLRARSVSVDDDTYVDTVLDETVDDDEVRSGDEEEDWGDMGGEHDIDLVSDG